MPDSVHKLRESCGVSEVMQIEDKLFDQTNLDFDSLQNMKNYMSFNI